MWNLGLIWCIFTQSLKTFHWESAGSYKTLAFLFNIYCALQHWNQQEYPRMAANRPFSWKLLLGMQTAAAPPGGQTEYWQKYQHATWLYVLENQNTDSSTSLYCSTPGTTTLCTAVLTEVTGSTYCMSMLTTHISTRIDRLFKGVLWSTRYKPRPVAEGVASRV